MKILAIDTSSEICSTAILENDVLIDENNLDNGRTHSENLMPLVDELLKRNNININEIGLISCVVGPGSFTGIRIGVSSMKPIAEVLGISLASITSLEVLAKNVIVEDKEKIVSLIDARNNQVYAGIFDKEYNLVEDYIADDIMEVIEKIKKYENITFVGNGSVLHKDILISNIKNAKFSEENKQSAKNAGLLGYKKYLENNLHTADTIIPIYLRKSQAERLKK